MCPSGTRRMGENMPKTPRARNILLDAVPAACMCAALSLVIPVGVTHADEHDDRVKLSGFGTAGLVRSSEDRADYVAGQFRPTGAGHSDTWSHKVDSRLGVQLDVAFTDRWSAVVQVISEQRHDDGYKPTVEWANIRYAPNEDLSIRIGRIVLPTFIVADTRKVGYANTWIRPPAELYSLSPLSSSDGVDMSYRIRSGAWTHTMRASFGRFTIRLPNDISFDGHKLAGLYQTAEVGALTLRASYVRAVLEFEELNEFFGAFRQFGPEGDRIAERFTIDGKLASVWSIGASYQPFDWFVMAELGTQDTRSAFGKNTAWYISAGRRIAGFTPYVTIARIRRDDETSTPGLDTTSLPPAEAALATALNAQLNAIMGDTVQQDALSAGVRWDFRPRVALKLQLDHIDIARGSPGMFTNRQPGFEPGGSANLVSIGLDFVF